MKNVMHHNFTNNCYGSFRKHAVYLKPLVISKNRRKLLINPLTPELNISAQRCLTRFLLGILLLEP
jgi:hypothetical protein